MHSRRSGENQEAQERRQSMAAKMNANQRGLAVADDGRGKEIGPWGVIVNVGICPGPSTLPADQDTYHRVDAVASNPYGIGRGVRRTGITN